MTNKYKISDLAKDFNISSKDAIAIITEITGSEKKASATINEQEIGQFFNKVTKDNAVKDFKAYFATGDEARAEVLLFYISYLAIEVVINTHAKQYH